MKANSRVIKASLVACTAFALALTINQEQRQTA